jgi:hypothetical protein
MNDWLNDLYPHQAWADAELWRSIGAHPSARDDKTIHQRLHHIHFVQHAFLWTVGDRTQPFRIRARIPRTGAVAARRSDAGASG